MCIFIFLILMSLSSTSYAIKQPIPEPVQNEVGELTQNFASLLVGECPKDLCFAKGCEHLAHETTVSLPEQAVPGIALPENTVGGAQHRLTRAVCHFAYETAIAGAPLAALKQRLRAKLSTKAFAVQIASEELPPNAIANSEVVNPPALPPPSRKEQLWQELRPHTPWMLGMVLGCAVLCLLIWGYRRLGKDSLEEQLLAHKIRAEDDAPKTQVLPTIEGIADPMERMRQEIMTSVERWQELASSLLEDGQFAALAASLHYFPGHSMSFMNYDRRLLVKRAKFQEYLQTTTPLLAPAELYQVLTKRLLLVTQWKEDESLLLSRIWQYLAPKDIARLLAAMRVAVGKVILCFLPRPYLAETIMFLPSEVKKSLAWALLTSNRGSLKDLDQAIHWARGITKGAPIPVDALDDAPEVEIVPLDCEEALSLLLAAISQDEKKLLLAQASATNHNRIPEWCSGVFYESMLLNIPEDILSDILLSLNAAKLAVWLHQVQDTGVKDKVKRAAPETLRKLLGSPTLEVLHASTQAVADIEKSFSLEIRKRHEGRVLSVAKLL